MLPDAIYDQVRRSAITWTPARFQRISDRLSRTANTVLHAASVAPLATGKPEASLELEQRFRRDA
jgi:hypothetical protein